MNTRMDRYENLVSENGESLSRVRKNDSLYNEIKTTDLSRVKTANNIKIIESNGKTIDLEKVRKYIEENKKSTSAKRSSIKIEPIKEEKEEKEEVTKEYDIISVLEKAKQNREIDYEKERYKRLRETQYEILNKIKSYEEEPRKEEVEEDLNTEERTLVNLINTITIHKGEEDLLGELIGGKTEEITLPIEKEVERGTLIDEIENNNDNNQKEELEKTRELVELKERSMETDKSFFTNSMTFSKDDFEGFEELEKSVKKNSVLTRIMLILLVLIIIISIVIITNYVFKLGLF